MIEIKILATGSEGNAYIITVSDDDGNYPRSILIDPGIRWKLLNERSGFMLHNVEFCLVSHEHKDHTLALKDVIRFGIPVVMSLGTMTALDTHPCDIEHLAVSEQPFKIGSRDEWHILPFATQHDALEPLGFIIRTPQGEKIMYATDTYYIKYNFKYPNPTLFTPLNYYIVEANYQKEILDTNDDLHPAHKDRVRQSHFEIENLKGFFRNQDLSVTKKIYLIHLSNDNSDEAYFKSEIEKVTGLPVYFR